MTTGFSREQLAAMTQEMEAYAPAPLTIEDNVRADAISETSLAATELGILLRLASKQGQVLDFFINPVLTLELLFCIYEAGEKNRWILNKREAPRLIEHSLAKEQDLAAAVPILSFRLGSEAGGAVLALADGRAVKKFYLARKLLADILGMLAQANSVVGWWDEYMALVPNDGTRLQ